MMSARLDRQFLSLFFLFAAGAAHAAEQGEMGATSSGSIGISISIAPQATVSGLADIDLRGATTDRLSGNFCLLSNSLAQSYTVTALGSGHEGLFELSSGEHVMRYNVTWTPQGTALANSHGAIMQMPAASSEADCEVGLGTADFVLEIAPAHQTTVRTNAPVTGALTLIFAPE